MCSIKASCLRPIPEKTATDEPYIELSVRRQGYEVRYLPTAVVRIRCPTNIVDFFKQRKRIWIGHMQLRRDTGFIVSTSNFGNILLAVAKLKPSEPNFDLTGLVLAVPLPFSWANDCSPFIRKLLGRDPQ